MLQNRVNPFGDIIKTPARGAWLGNRGVIHNENKEIARPFRLKAWIICMLEFRGRHREVMMPDRWTELFFVDEATAFSAGHRPCFQCRYADHQRFKAAWLAGNPAYGFDEKTSIHQIDDIIHRERIGKNKSKITYMDDVTTLPDGAFVLVNEQPYLVANGGLYLWTPFGYEDKIAFPANSMLEVLTPRSIVNTFSAGYLPQMGTMTVKQDTSPE
ncbi:hypothetical protein [Mucilaginibacter sp. PPCGB 2223]|uniref:hypothetical protein n=1 Tax=Mucilaginibacter sp. PPCGB 2223 TaxID=1886027 RepID=UPI0009F2CE19|nr:hypothetical protein [Mucilaginibacter sp. PPCGB 2223]